MEYAAPNDNSSAHSVSLNTPTVSKILLEESVRTQSTSRKIAGVRISAGLMCGRYFFMTMGTELEDKDRLGTTCHQ